MINVGVIGLGMMGQTHLDVYRRRADVRVVAVADIISDRRTGRSRTASNIDGHAGDAFDFGSAKQYDEGMRLIEDPDVQAVDICLTTPLHLRYALAAIHAGKHVLIEKPLARTAHDAYELADAAEHASTITMCAMCMRFWPEWVWLKDAISSHEFGNVLSATFRRVASHPGGDFYTDAAANGGAALDLHIHDTDFIQYCFGLPDAVTTVGYSSVTSGIDHLVTRYTFKRIPLVIAEGGWGMCDGFGFRMQYTVNFEKATASFDLASTPTLTLWRPEGPSGSAVNVPAGIGYEHEIGYFLDCIRTGSRAERVTVREAANSVAIVEAELRSLQSGRPEPLPKIAASRKKIL